MNTVRLEQGETAVITLVRPQALNALNIELMEELAQAIDEVRDSKEARCLIITGEGQKSFAAGADIGAMESMDSQEALRLAQKGCRVMDAVAELGDTVKKMAAKICDCASLGVAAAKKAMRKYAGLQQSSECENKLFARLFGTQDQKTGMYHFNQKMKTERFEGK